MKEKSANSVLKAAIFCLYAFTGTALISVPAFSQELDATVEVDLQALNIDVQDRLSSFKTDIQNYLNRTRFTDENITNDIKGKPYKIKCSFQFFFRSSPSIDSYESQMVIIVQRNIYRTQNYTTVFRLRDDIWAFNYIKGQNFYHDDLRYNSLTSFLDYYAYMAIGFDDDSWEPGLGSQRFIKAQNVVNLAVANSDGRGWTDNSSLKQSRSVFPQELLNSKHDKFRRAFWLYHFSGMDSLQYNKRTALERITEALELIGKLRKNEVRSFIIKQFFDNKYLEIAATLVDHYDKTIYRRLMEYDPDHAPTYEEYAKK